MLTLQKIAPGVRAVTGKGSVQGHPIQPWLAVRSENRLVLLDVERGEEIHSWSFEGTDCFHRWAGSWIVVTGLMEGEAFLSLFHPETGEVRTSPRWEEHLGLCSSELSIDEKILSVRGKDLSWTSNMHVALVQIPEIDSI